MSLSLATTPLPLLSVKSPALTPLTSPSKVTVNDTLPPDVYCAPVRLMPTTDGAVLSSVYSWPVAPALMALPARSAMPVPLDFRFSPNVPLPLAPVTATV